MAAANLTINLSFRFTWRAHAVLFTALLLAVVAKRLGRGPLDADWWAERIVRQCDFVADGKKIPT